MRFCLIHLALTPHPEEEAAVVVPGGEKTAMLVPLDALGQFLRILHDAVADQDNALCGGCGEVLPGSRP